jgi:hypothetical protein
MFAMDLDKWKKDHLMGTWGSKNIYLQDPRSESPSMDAVRDDAVRDVSNSGSWRFFLDQIEMTIKKWNDETSNYCHIVVTPKQFETMRSWESPLKCVGIPRPEDVDWSAEKYPLYVHHPIWSKKSSYGIMTKFGISVRRWEKWKSSKQLQHHFHSAVEASSELGESYSSIIYDRQPNGRWKLRDESKAMSKEAMSEEKTKIEMLNTFDLLKTALKEGAIVVAADRANAVLCDKGVKRTLEKLGFKREFLDTQAGEILMKLTIPCVLNEACLRTTLIPHRELVAKACQAAMQANFIHLLGPVLDGLAPTLTALRQVGQELVEEQTSTKTEAPVAH